MLIPFYQPQTNFLRPLKTTSMPVVFFCLPPKTNRRKKIFFYVIFLFLRRKIIIKNRDKFKYFREHFFRWFSTFLLLKFLNFFGIFFNRYCTFLSHKIPFRFINQSGEVRLIADCRVPVQRGSWIKMRNSIILLIIPPMKEWQSECIVCRKFLLKVLA